VVLEKLGPAVMPNLTCAKEAPATNITAKDNNTFFIVFYIYR
jgi:hypothetical protein